MSACRSHAELIGPYVLAALEPGEMDEMRRHLAACERCAAEARALAGLPALLDEVQAESALAGAAPPAPSPELEDAVLDRFVRDRAAAPSPPRRRRWRPLAAAAGLAAAAALAVVAVWPGDDGSAYARAEMRGHGARVVASAAAVDAGTRVHVEADRLRRGTYELWCIRTDGSWVSGGSFHSRANGTASADLTAAVRPGAYHVVVITRPRRGAEIMRGKLEY